LSRHTGEDANPPEEKAAEKATEAVAHANETMESIANQVFQLYSNLLMEEARRPWNKILGEQIDYTPWIDLFGVKHADKRKRSWSSFMDCVTFHLQTVFRSDPAETQRFYMSNGLKKPNRVPIQQFVQRIQKLNGYLDLLPCLYYSDRVTKLTKEVKPFIDVDLASHILRMVPRNWQDQYKLTGATVPQSVCKLLKVLDCIEKAFPTDKEHNGTQANVNGGGSSKKKMVSFSDQIPKKRRIDAKHCILCKKHGGTHNTHNTTKCRRNENDGTPKP
jgi:protein involved in ribonucleotide reduction